MRISKAIKPILVALGAPASEVGGKSLSRIATYVSPYAVDFITKNKDFVVRYTAPEEEGDDWTCDKELDDILDAIYAGKNVYAIPLDEATSLETVLRLAQYSPESSEELSSVTFTAVSACDGTPNIIAAITIVHTEEGITVIRSICNSNV